MMPEFQEFKKIPRLSREIIITEKIDGTNGLIYISDDCTEIYAGSKSRWLDDHNDNFGFYHWVMDNKEELMKLGKGYHYGEWWGKGIQRNYGLNEKRFSLFNVGRWVDYRNIPCGQFPREYEDFYLKKLKEESKNDKLEYCPECCYVVPILYRGQIHQQDFYAPDEFINYLKSNGSMAVPRFMDPEGIVIYHVPSRYYFKKTIKNDEKGKEQ
jgi:hypothetical protein